MNPLIRCARTGKRASSSVALRDPSPTMNVLTVAVCQSKAFAYLTGDDVNIFYALYPNRIFGEILHGIS